MSQDPKLNSHSKLNCILACIQANKAGADEALMAGVSSFGYAGTIAHAVLSQVATSEFRREDLQSSRLVSDVYGNRCSFPWKRIDTISMNMPL